ncbi:MAG TPA: GTP cyclohydrolase I FolE [Nitriliruptorales bacterium]|nr:GTP cyclohydrolase I FolE [Nitriliruptorales bacterium]
MHARPVDGERATAAVVDLLEALGLDTRSEGLSDTPRRVAAMLTELLTPVPFRPTTFPNDAGYDELVLVSDIAFTSLCEHHLLPFRGVAHVGYVPGERIVGLSKLPRLVEAFARRPQIQERMTSQIADWLRAHLEPRGVGVVLEAEHLCMSIRGVRADGARTVTSTLYGLLRDRPASRQEFLQLARTASRSHP